MGEQGESTRTYKRLRGLLVLLGLCALGGVAHYGRVWYYERQLLDIAHELVDEANREDPLPMAEEGPQADVEIRVMCSFAYLVFGPMTGKISLIIKPRAHAPDMNIGGIEYVYVHQDGQWERWESYHM